MASSTVSSGILEANSSRTGGRTTGIAGPVVEPQGLASGHDGVFRRVVARRSEDGSPQGWRYQAITTTNREAHRFAAQSVSCARTGVTRLRTVAAERPAPVNSMAQMIGLVPGDVGP